jgi:HEAT repeats
MFEPFGLLAGVIGATAALTAALARRGEKYRAASWKQRAAECSLTAIETGRRFPFREFLRGRRGPHGVRIERFKEGKSNRGIRIVIDGLAQGVSLKREGLGTAIGKTLGSREIEIGDVPFDESLFVRGEPAVLRALLDAETRRMALEVFGSRVPMEPFASRYVGMSVSVAAGELRSEFPDRLGVAQDEPQVETLQALLALAERLAPFEGTVERLAAIARKDPVSRVRGHALAMLQRDIPAAPITLEAMTASLGDADPDVRLFAALSQKEAGRPVLEELATGRDVPDECSARAVEALGDGLSLDVGCRALEVARAGDKEKTALAVILPVARAGGVDAVVQALGMPNDAVAAAAARALGAVQARAAEEALLEALGRDSDEVRMAAAHALSVVGSIRAVLPLKELEQHGRRGVDKAAREAIARIQASLQGATPGQLAIADDASGHVSVSDDPSGRVTLPDS